VSAHWRERGSLAHHPVYGQFLIMWRLRSGAPCLHQIAPRSPMARFAFSTAQ
jgi:hypothetical protein